MHPSEAQVLYINQQILSSRRSSVTEPVHGCVCDLCTSRGGKLVSESGKEQKRGEDIWNTASITSPQAGTDTTAMSIKSKGRLQHYHIHTQAEGKVFFSVCFLSFNLNRL